MNNNIHYVWRKITRILGIPRVNNANMSSGKHKPVVQNCIGVNEIGLGLVLCKKCPSGMRALKEGNSEVEDSNKREIFVPPQQMWELGKYLSSQT